MTPDSVAGTGTNPAAVVDAHVHLWDLAVHPQPWTEPFPALRRSFLLPDLRDVLTAGGIDAAIVVQASDSSSETLDLLALAGIEPALAGVVGWIDFTAGDVADQIAALGSAPGGDHLVGLRHQLQLEPDRQWLARDQVRKGLSRLSALGPCFDIVVSANQLPLVVDAVTALPDTRFVLDHAGKPPIATGDLAAWKSDLARLAARPNVAVKLSGLVTEADWKHWRQDQLEPVITHTLESFGPSRVMAGSDWPVCLLAADYPTVQSTLAPALARMSSSERADVLGDTAMRWYKRPA